MARSILGLFLSHSFARDATISLSAIARPEDVWVPDVDAVLAFLSPGPILTEIQ